MLYFTGQEMAAEQIKTHLALMKDATLAKANQFEAGKHWERLRRVVLSEKINKRHEPECSIENLRALQRKCREKKRRLNTILEKATEDARKALEKAELKAEHASTSYKEVVSDMKRRMIISEHSKAVEKVFEGTQYELGGRKTIKKVADGLGLIRQIEAQHDRIKARRNKLKTITKERSSLKNGGQCLGRENLEEIKRETKKTSKKRKTIKTKKTEKKIKGSKESKQLRKKESHGNVKDHSEDKITKMADDDADDVLNDTRNIQYEAHEKMTSQNSLQDAIYKHRGGRKKIWGEMLPRVIETEVNAVVHWGLHKAHEMGHSFRNTQDKRNLKNSLVNSFSKTASIECISQYIGKKQQKKRQSINELEDLKIESKKQGDPLSVLEPEINEVARQKSKDWLGSYDTSMSISSESMSRKHSSPALHNRYGESVYCDSTISSFTMNGSLKWNAFQRDKRSVNEIHEALKEFGLDAEAVELEDSIGRISEVEKDLKDKLKEVKKAMHEEMRRLKMQENEELKIKKMKLAYARFKKKEKEEREREELLRKLREEAEKRKLINRKFHKEIMLLEIENNLSRNYNFSYFTRFERQNFGNQ